MCGQNKLLDSLRYASYEDFSKKRSDSIIYTIVDIPAQFEGGEGKYQQYQKDNIKYPQKLKNSNIAEIVRVKVIIEKDGCIVINKFFKDYNKEFINQVILFIECMPKWIPGSIDGEKVRTERVLSFRFCPDDC